MKARAMETVPSHWEYDDVFEGLELGCGQLLLDLKLHMSTLSPGQRLMVASRDIGSPVEIPAWCRLTGHRLLAANPPFYLIEPKPNDKE